MQSVPNRRRRPRAEEIIIEDPPRRQRNRNRNNRRQSKPTSETKSGLSYVPYGQVLGTAIGGAAYGPVGAAVGGVVGSGVQSLIRHVTGFGDYEVSQNFFTTNQDAVPDFSNDARCTIVTHREYIMDVVTGPISVGTSTNFNLNTFAINPGLNTTFPWLNQIAANYEEYVVQGMLFEFKTNSATAVSSTNTALGTVILATQYNSLAPDFVNKQQMENYDFAQSAVPSESILHAIECDPKKTVTGGKFYVRAPLDAPGDVRLYDIGKFSIATQGMQRTNTTLGELWVTYKICFLKPRLGMTTFAPSHVRIDPTTFDPVASPFGAPYSDSLITISGNLVTLSPNFIGVIEVSYVMRGGDVGTEIGSLHPTGPNIQPLAAFDSTINSLNSFLYLDGTIASTSAQQCAFFGCSGGLGDSFDFVNCAVTSLINPLVSIDLWVVPFGAISPGLFN